MRTMGDDLVYLFASVFLAAAAFVGAAVYRPVRAACPPAWHHDGVRRSGAFECTRSPVGDTWPPGRLEGRIYCTGGTVPVVVTERVVGCQRR